MELLAIKFVVALLGISLMIIGAYFWRLTEKISKGRLVPRPFGVWWSHGRTYFMAVLLWLLGIVLLIVGLIR